MNYPRVALGEVAKIVSGSTPKTGTSSYWDGDISWATPKDLSNISSKYIAGTGRNITAEGLRSCAASILPAGSVLLSSRAPIGHVAINQIPMATNQGFKSLVPDSTRIDASYLYHWLKANRLYLDSLGNGATFKEVSKATVSRVEIPLPSLGEQRRIAELLDRSDELCKDRRRSIASLDALERSLFMEMFGEASTQWPSVAVSELAADHKGSIRTGPFGSQLLHEEFVNSGIAVLGIDNAVSNTFSWRERRFITEEKYEKLKRYTVRPGDVIITIMGTCGRCAVVPDDIPVAINTKHLCCITLDREKCLPQFLHAYFLQHPVAQSYLGRTAKGAIMSGLNMEIIKNLPVALPPLRRQEEFATRLQATRKVREAQVVHGQELDDLFAALRNRAFRGEL